MKKLRLVMSLLCMLLLAGPIMATGLNIIPNPKEMTAGTGVFQLRKGVTVGGKNLPTAMTAEVSKFVNTLNATTGLQARTTSKKGKIAVEVDPSLPAEGYTLSVTRKGVTIKASQPAGLFYAFQTIKKMLPDNVLAGIAQPGARYELPVVEIADEPRFGYRGFMLDVSRHFFDVDQVKKMIDLMAIYKLNRFHWHLTDDQGWRLPVAKYPKLTVEGATNRNILQSDFDAQKQTRPGKDVAYGPYAYTADEIRDVVAYAKERHIEVIPEIDMPGHMVAAIHAYPEMSTDPESKRAIAAGVDLDSEPVAGNIESHFTHNIWNIGGVSKDVLDISNPKVMTFAKDVVDVLAELFPYEYIHIGGDECPTNAWANSESCQALKAQLGLKSDDALQSWFTKQIADYAKEKHGRKIMGWNELITSGGADIAMLKELDPVIFCWYPPKQAVEVSENNGFKHVYTPFNGGYYINRSYKGFDKIGAVGDGSLATAYKVNPPANEHCVGVQGTFWTEQVDRYKDLEYLALPRLIAVAEQGWTPDDRKDYADFMKRLKANLPLLEMSGYNYGRHQIEELPAE